MTARSTLSHVAGLYGEATVVYDPFNHKPLRGWIVRSEDGSLARRP